ncbi:MAG: endonuclease NucS [Chloroflexota bacterium]|nr:endonuclease NucS [Chloroflexota bacterium]
MPIEVGIWCINDEIERVEFSSIETEKKLETILDQNIGLLDPNIMVIGRQQSTAYGKYIDLLAIDSQGDLVIIELKRNRTSRDVVAQLLDYASWAQNLSYEEITSIYSENNPGRKFEQAFSERFEIDPPERLNENLRLLIVSFELDNSTERIIDYLSSGFSVPVNAVFFRYFKDHGNEYLSRTWLIDPSQAEIQSSKSPRSKKEIWNGRDWYASLGVGELRNWSDCQKYGFISAGQGKWYSNTLHHLPPGARVFVCVPKNGYVGVGIVKEKAVRVRDFVVEIDGEEKPILELALEAPNMAKNAENEELSEYLVRMEWVRTVPLEQTIWEKGMFANQNSACKLRNKFTIERLTELFNLEED